MKHRQNGFSLVEVLIVISVLGILVTIGTVGWGGMVKWSQNNARGSELEQWASTFKLYHSRFAAYPLSNEAGTFCLGDNFVGDKCGLNDAYNEKATLMTEIKKVGKVPQNDHPKVNANNVGPYVTYSGTSTKITNVFQGDGASTCPKGTTYEVTSPAGAAYCYITLAP